MAALAIHGGTPVRTIPFPSWPQFDARELSALERVLQSGAWGTLGPEVESFVQQFAAYQHARYGVAVTNGTVSLEIILKALGIGPGDEVILPPYTFNATTSAILMAGAKPIFVDIEPDTFNIDPVSIENAITPQTRAIVPVHVGARPCDMDAITAIARRHDLFVIEDAAQAHGSEWRGQRVGSIGDAGSFSFQASKNLTAGEGGFITTNEPELFRRCWSIHHCGREIDGNAWYDHPNLGTNARMTEWQAAILKVQMERLDQQIETRMTHAARLTQHLLTLPGIETLRQDERITRNSFHIYIFKWKTRENKGVSRDRFLQALQAEGIPCGAGYRPLYRQGMLRGKEALRIFGHENPYQNFHLEHTENAAAEGVWLMQDLFLGTSADIDDIFQAIEKISGHVDTL